VDRSLFFDPAPVLDDFLRQATVILDTNVLLDLYRLSPESRESTLNVLHAVRNRVWLPHQVGVEFYRNLDNVRGEIGGAYDAARKMIRGLADSVAGPKGHFREGRAFEETRTAVRKAIDASAKALADQLDHLQAADPACIDPHDDAVLRRIEGTFAGRTGQRPDFVTLADRAERFVSRASMQIPPGYTDLGKGSAMQAAGDYLVWCEVLDHAHGAKTDVLFVTGDGKDDWWDGPRGRRTGPRKELIHEFISVTGRAYHQVTHARFVERAQTVLRTKVDRVAVEEIRTVERQTSAEDQALAEMIEDARAVGILGWDPHSGQPAGPEGWEAENEHQPVGPRWHLDG
jgi:hypothetical protein